MNLKGIRFENARLDMEIFVYNVDGKEWFIGKDIAEILGYSNPSTAISENVSVKNKKKIYVKTIENIGNSEIPNSDPKYYMNNLMLINEIGLYEMVMRSRKREAQDFQQWIYEEVLPSIRKHGMYAEQGITEEQVERYMEENRAFKNIILNMQACLGTKKSLKIYIETRFPKIEDAYEQVIGLFKNMGILDSEGYPTPSFLSENKKEKIMIFEESTTDIIKTKISLTSAGMYRLAKSTKEVDGKIVFEKCPFDI